MTKPSNVTENTQVKTANTVEEAKERLKELATKKAETQPEPTPEVDEQPTTPKGIEPEKSEVTETAIQELKPVEITDGQIHFTDRHRELIRKQIAKDLNQTEFDLFMMMAVRFRLDPLANQLTALVFNKNDPSKRKVSFVTTIDGLRLIAHRTGQFDGIDEPSFEYSNNKLQHCSVKVYRKGASHPFSARVKFSEYSTGERLWDSKPETMIAKVAEAHALRKAFPQELSGIYTVDEMEQSTPQVVEPVKPPKKMITKAQAQLVSKLIDEKGMTVDQVKDLIQKTFSKETFKALTFDECQMVIEKLQKMPTQVLLEAEETEVDSREIADAVDQYMK